MTPEITITPQPDPDDDRQMRVDWSVAVNGRTVAFGQMTFVLDTAHFFWHGQRPPGEYESDVRLAIDRAIRQRTA